MNPPSISKNVLHTTPNKCTTVMKNGLLCGFLTTAQHCERHFDVNSIIIEDIKER